MSRETVIAAACMIASLVGRTALAGDDYLCTVKDVRQLSDSGELIPPEPVFSFLIGQQFAVDRATGKMTGDVEHPIFSRTIVVDEGSGEQSFKVAILSTSENAFLHTLHVQEFVEIAEKPFVYHDTLWLRSGTCVYL